MNEFGVCPVAREHPPALTPSELWHEARSHRRRWCYDSWPTAPPCLRRFRPHPPST